MLNHIANVIDDGTTIPYFKRYDHNWYQSWGTVTADELLELELEKHEARRQQNVKERTNVERELEFQQAREQYRLDCEQHASARDTRRKRTNAARQERCRKHKSERASKRGNRRCGTMFRNRRDWITAYEEFQLELYEIVDSNVCDFCGGDPWHCSCDYDSCDISVSEYVEYQLVSQFLASRQFNGPKPKNFEDYLRNYYRYHGIRSVIRDGYCEYCGGFHLSGVCFEQRHLSVA